LAGLDLADVLSDQGLANANLKNIKVQIPFAVSINQAAYYTEVSASYSAKRNKLACISHHKIDAADFS
jgi:hypothetical protein